MLRTRWYVAAVRVFGAELVDRLLALARRAAAAIRLVVDLVRAAADVAAVLYVHCGRFRRWRLLAEARCYLAHELRGIQPGQTASSVRGGAGDRPQRRPWHR